MKTPRSFLLSHGPMDNGDRADMALPALQEFIRVAYGNPGDEPLDCAISDLICDLLHLAQRENHDPMLVARTALGAYCDERDYPPDGFAPAGEHARIAIALTRKDPQ